MKNRIIYPSLSVGLLLLAMTSCKTPGIIERVENREVPEQFAQQDAVQDTLSTADINWKEYFTDPYLNALIDTALQHNQELNITLQEVRIFNNEIRARQGEYLPYVNVRGGADVAKSGRYTARGASEANVPIEPGKATPDPLPNYFFGLYADWEIDIWNKLHNARDAAAAEYAASTEAKNFMVTNLIAEIANSYYELLALDNQLQIVRRNIEIQSNALEIVKLQKQAARVTELAVRKFEAEVMHTRSLQYEIRQEITETENRINFLLGRFPQPVERSSESFVELVPDTIHSGIPSQLLTHRPDIRQAEQELVAARLDVKVARANFYPSLNISAGVGYQAYQPSLLLTSPQSLLYSIAGDIMAPLVNRRAITAAYYNANARQIQAAYRYEQTVLNAYVEVSNQLSMINNLEQSFDLKTKEVEALTQSIDISADLFKSARADYMEVLMTQRDALESKFELIETKKRQMNAMVNIYRALGGGWN